MRGSPLERDRMISERHNNYSITINNIKLIYGSCHARRQVCLRLNSIHIFTTKKVQNDVMFTIQLTKYRPVVCTFWEKRYIHRFKIKAAGCLRLHSPWSHNGFSSIIYLWIQMRFGRYIFYWNPINIGIINTLHCFL